MLTSYNHSFSFRASVFSALILCFAFLGGCAGQFGDSSGTWNSGQTTQANDSAAQAQIPNDNALDPMASAPPVKIGILLPLSGQHQKLGQSLLNAAQMALFDLGQGHFELLPRDTKGTPEGAAAAAQDALENGTQILLGPVFSSSVRAVQPIAQRANVNIMAFSTDWTLASQNSGRGAKGTYVMGFMPFDQVERMADYMGQRGLRNVGILSPANTYGDSVLSTFKAASAPAGITTSVYKRYPQDQKMLEQNIKDFVQTAQERGSRPNALLIPAGGNEIVTMSNLLTQYGMPPNTVRRVGTGLWDDPKLLREPAMQGAWFASPEPNSGQNFRSQYTQIYGTQPARLSSLAYDATALAVILAKHGYKNGQNRQAYDHMAITNPNGFAGIDGVFRFRRNGLVERALAVLEIQNGTLRVIDKAPVTFQAAIN
jgi:branched-chain amino acid transport system substrate-binding protein